MSKKSEAEIEQAHAEYKDATRAVDVAREKLLTAIEAYYGLESGKTIVADANGRKFIYQKLDLFFDNVPKNQPWVKGYMLKKGGIPSALLRTIYSDWKVVKP